MEGMKGVFFTLLGFFISFVAQWLNNRFFKKPKISIKVLIDGIDNFQPYPNNRVLVCVHAGICFKNTSSYKAVDFQILEFIENKTGPIPFDWDFTHEMINIEATSSTEFFDFKMHFVVSDKIADIKDKILTELFEYDFKLKCSYMNSFDKTFTEELSTRFTLHRHFEYDWVD